MEKLIGKKITGIFINSDYLKFETDGGDVCFRVDGECCSRSYFYDFIGVEKLLKNGVVLNLEEIEDYPDDGKRKGDEDSVSCYGYRITTKDQEFGEVSSVVSFRNDSNGYYGGSMEECGSIPEKEVLQEIKQDWYE